ncbi:MAG: GNAT family N-acetyltransferase [Erysipelothrix sp.]|nr:GNAT family N-acetyltransferase [Erysipelothrix sp.]
MLITVKQYPLETKRTFLRAFNQSDLNDFFEYAKGEVVGEMAGWIHHNNPSETQMILDSFIDKDNVYAIVDKKSLKVIGSLGLEDSKYYQHLKVVES